MLEPPFDIISCSWRRPVEHAHDQWKSDKRTREAHK